MGFGWLFLALLAFLLGHAVASVPPVRRRLVAVLGEGAYLWLYSLFSLALLVWVFAALLAAPYVQLWFPDPWTRWVPPLVMPFACVLFVMGLTAPNPLSLSLRSHGYSSNRPGIVAVTRHPILWAVALWSLAHIIAAGHAGALLVFGLMGLFAVAGGPLLDARARRRLGEAEWQRLRQSTSHTPFLALAQGRANLNWRPGDINRALGGLVLYIILAVAHPIVIGQSPWPVL